MQRINIYTNETSSRCKLFSTMMDIKNLDIHTYVQNIIRNFIRIYDEHYLLQCSQR